MSSRTDQGLVAKITDGALLEEGARILSSPTTTDAASRGARGTGSEATAEKPRRRDAGRSGVAPSTRWAS